jgi:hypothetical protein
MPLLSAPSAPDLARELLAAAAAAAAAQQQQQHGMGSAGAGLPLLPPAPLLLGMQGLQGPLLPGVPVGALAGLAQQQPGVGASVRAPGEHRYGPGARVTRSGLVIYGAEGPAGGAGGGPAHADIEAAAAAAAAAAGPFPFPLLSPASGLPLPLPVPALLPGSGLPLGGGDPYGMLERAAASFMQQQAAQLQHFAATDLPLPAGPAAARGGAHGAGGAPAPRGQNTAAAEFVPTWSKQ